MHGEDTPKHLQGEGCTWLTVSTMVDDQTEVVELEQEAKIDEGPILA